MRCWTFLLTFVVASSLGAFASAADGFDWDIWRPLPVQNGGRHKPLDTLSWESLRMIANRGGIADPQTGEQLTPIAWYLTMLFDWKGWDHAERDQLQLVVDWRPLYAHLHAADRWDETPLLRVDYLPLRATLQLAKDQRHVSPAFLVRAAVADASIQQKVPFSTWADKLLERQQADERLTELEEKGLELAERFWAYQNLRMGRMMEVIPVPGDPEGKWMPLAYLAITGFDDSSDPGGNLRHAQGLLRLVRDSFHRGDSSQFNQTSREFVAAMRKIGNRAEGYPNERTASLEVMYNQWAPFRIAWLLMLVACVGMLLHLGSGWSGLQWCAMVAYGLALIAMAAGFALRIAVSGRPPVTNMYESVVYVGAGVAIFGLMFEWIYRRKYVLTAAAGVATVVLVLADNCPMILDPSVRPLEPVLRSNFWLVTHVMTITLSYAALALALGIANITLGYYLIGSDKRAVISALSRFTYKAIQAGVWLLATGIILGGVWADYSWGRFWGWDPKEVWALVALLGYLAVLHARYAGWVGHRGLAVLSVGCFSLVVMAWYGVNFVLGAGLHSYGFGGGGQAYVYSAVGLQLLYAAVAAGRSMLGDHQAVDRPWSAPRQASNLG